MRDAPNHISIAGGNVVRSVWREWFRDMGTEVDTNGDDIDTLESEKADKVTGATADNLASLDSDGGLLDSGKASPDGDVVGTTDTQTLTGKTLTTPTIASFTNAAHDHSNAANAGALYGYSGSFQIQTDAWNDGGTHKKKTRTLTFSGGLLTTLGSESAWTAI